MTPPIHPSLIRTGRSLHALGFCTMLGLAVGPYVAAGLPMSAQNAALRRQIEKTTRLLELESNVAARHEQLSREAADHERRRREVLERIPEMADGAQFYGQLAELAGSSQLTLHDYRPGVAEKKKAYSQMDIALSAEGSYEQLCRFVAGLESLPRFCRLVGVTVNRAEGDVTLLHMTFTLRIFFNSSPDKPAMESTGERDMSLRFTKSSTPAWKIAVIPVLAVVLLKVLQQTPAAAPVPEPQAVAESDSPPVAPETRPLSKLPELSLDEALEFDPFGQLALSVGVAKEPPQVPPDPVVEAAPRREPAQPLADRAAALRELKVSAVFPSSKGSAAIINSKTVRPGDLLSPGVRVVEIRGTNVILRVEGGDAKMPEPSAESAIR